LFESVVADQIEFIERPVPIGATAARQAGRLNLDELITTKYRLEDMNQGYQDMKEGNNVRCMVVYTDAVR
jgi:threonine dehydrogenase-like Zn-dependent dehydrogenase